MGQRKFPGKAEFNQQNLRIRKGAEMSKIKVSTIIKLGQLTPEQLEEVDIVLTKFISQEPVTDQERKENPEMWANAEKYFNFGKAQGGSRV